MLKNGKILTNNIKNGKIKDEIYSYFKNTSSIEFIFSLEKIGNLYFIGGILREFKDYEKIKSVHDVDIIIDVNDLTLWNLLVQKYKPSINKFNGYKFTLSNSIVDVWFLKECWAFREHKIICNSNEYVNFLPKTVFLNIDSIIYDWSNDKWNDDIYQQAMDTGMLDIVLKENPYIELNILRAIVFKEKYQMQFSNNLLKLIKNYDIENLYTNLCSVQETRYKNDIISKEIIHNTLIQCY